MKYPPMTKEQFNRLLAAMVHLGDLTPGPIFFPCQAEGELFEGLRKKDDRKPFERRRI